MSSTRTSQLVLLQHSLDMAAAFEAAGIPCAAVHGKLPAAEREDLLRKFKEGEYQVGR